MRNYPIWMDVTSCIYKSSKSYGVKNDGRTNIRVGTSANNSHLFGEIRITHHDLGENGKSFRLYIDGDLIKEAVVKDAQFNVTHQLHAQQEEWDGLTERLADSYDDNDQQIQMPLILPSSARFIGKGNAA